MKKKTILVITGTRAEYGLLLPIIRGIQDSKKLRLRLLVTGMHTMRRFGYTINDIRKDGIPITCVVPVGERDSMLTALSKEVRGIERYCMRERPDVVLVPSDRDEGFAGAIVAAHLGIPIAHYSGGDTSGGVDEQIRHAISRFAHVHFPISPSSAKRLIRLGEEPWRIHMTGTTVLDAKRPLESRQALAKALRLDTTLPWLLFVQHPTALDVEPVAAQIRTSLAALSGVKSQKIILYPNSDTGSATVIRAIESLKGRDDVRIIRSLPHRTYVSLLKHADVLVGNSSSGIVEAGFFGTPVVDIGMRQRGREHGGNVIHVPHDTKRIRAAILRALTPSFRAQAKRSPHPYGRGGAGKKIVRALERLTLDGHLMHKPI